MRAQTIWVASSATSYRAVCEWCLLEEEAPSSRAVRTAAVEGSLRLEADVGFTTCPRGHRLRVRRVARPVLAAAR